ncbi:hypothetical protein TNCV_3798851 [Trichonephila clavipes]|nr:hypothetical protein TNCV_3798851 [Trichonephila clavipes]
MIGPFKKKVIPLFLPLSSSKKVHFIERLPSGERENVFPYWFLIFFKKIKLYHELFIINYWVHVLAFDNLVDSVIFFFKDVNILIFVKTPISSLHH